MDSSGHIDRAIEEIDDAPEHAHRHQEVDRVIEEIDDALERAHRYHEIDRVIEEIDGLERAHRSSDRRDR